jgi:hypothetical protein
MIKENILPLNIIKKINNNNNAIKVSKNIPSNNKITARSRF